MDTKKRHFRKYRHLKVSISYWFLFFHLLELILNSLKIYVSWRHFRFLFHVFLTVSKYLKKRAFYI